MENQNLIQDKFTLKSELSETIFNLQTLNIKSENRSRKNRVLQEKRVSSNKTVKRTKHREDYWKTKCTKLETTTDKTKEDYQHLIYELQADNDQQRTTITELDQMIRSLISSNSYKRGIKRESSIYLTRKKKHSLQNSMYVCTLFSNTMFIQRKFVSISFS